MRSCCVLSLSACLQQGPSTTLISAATCLHLVYRSAAEAEPGDAFTTALHLVGTVLEN